MPVDPDTLKAIQDEVNQKWQQHVDDQRIYNGLTYLLTYVAGIASGIAIKTSTLPPRQ